jgi:coiled-coil domain-containing protein 55
MAHFYRQLLEESEQSHEETVAATQKPIIGPMPNLTITKPPNFTVKSDLELARIAREQGREVELNDDNQIVDKRELLAQPVQSHRAVGTAASRREINERRAREVLQQMEDEKKRVIDERVRAEEEATRRIVARRNNEEEIQSARERYLQRKRRKLDEMEQSSEQPFAQQPT